MEITIEFLRESKIYFPGDVVAGHLVISKNKETPIEGLFVRMEGKRFANVNPNVNYPEEYYFCEESRQAESSTILQPGKNQYPFSFTLPKNIPASIEVSRASVEYQIIVDLKVLGEFDKIVRAKFYVEGVFDLENDPTSTESREIKKNKSISLLCKGGYFGFVFKLERLGWLPGDFVSFISEINNSTSMDLQVKLYLIRELHFFDGGNFKKILSEYGTLCELAGPLVLPGEDKIWRGDVFKVPKVPPTHLGCRRLIELNYFLKISVTPTKLLQRSLEGKIPLIIGSPLVKKPLELTPLSTPLLNGLKFRDSNSSSNSPVPPVLVPTENKVSTLVKVPIVGISMRNCIVMEADEEEQ